MKTTVLTVFFTLISLSLSAQLISVVSPSGTTINYTDFKASIDGAESGSLIYLSGNASGFNIPKDYKINKKVHIVGVGYRADVNTVTGSTIVNGNINFIPGADGSSVMGIYLNGDIIIGETGLGSTGYKVPDLLIQQCSINRITQLTPDASSYGVPIKIHQNIIRSTENKLRVVNPIITNNIFLGDGVLYTLYYTSGARIFNNIFFAYNIGSGNENTYFSNNICLAGINSGYDNMDKNILCATKVFSNNYYNIAKDKIFKKWEGYAGFRYTDDYHLMDDCVGKNGGADGKDVGIYGGDGWKEGAIPFNPHIVSAEIAPETAADGTLKVKVKVSVDGQ